MAIEKMGDHIIITPARTLMRVKRSVRQGAVYPS